MLKNDKETLYALATRIMRGYINIYLELAKESNGINDIKPEFLNSGEKRMIVLAGKKSPLDPLSSTAEEVVEEWKRLRAIPFDIEEAMTKGVYIKLREKGE